MTSLSRCGACGQQAYRNRWGQMLMHTRLVQSDEIGSRPRPEVCEGSDLGARP